MPGLSPPQPGTSASHAAMLDELPDPLGSGNAAQTPPSPHSASASTPPARTPTPPSVEPAPAVIYASSHVDTHVLPRRFLGPMPQSVVTSDTFIEHRRRTREMRRADVTRLLRRQQGLAAEDAANERNLARDFDQANRRRHRFRIRRRDRLNFLHDIDVAIDASDTDSCSSNSSDEGTGSWFSSSKPETKSDKKKKKKKKKKDTDGKKDGKDDKNGGKKKKKKEKKKKDKRFKVWVGGEGFDIGREFDTTQGDQVPDPAVAGNLDADISGTPKAEDDTTGVLEDLAAVDDQDQNTALDGLRETPLGPAEMTGAFVPLDAEDRDSPIMSSKSKGKQRAETLQGDDASFFTARTRSTTTDNRTAASRGATTVSPPQSTVGETEPPARNTSPKLQQHEGDVDDVDDPPTAPPHGSSGGFGSPGLNVHTGTPLRSPSPVGSERMIPAMALGLHPHPPPERRPSTDTFSSARDEFHTPTSSQHEHSDDDSYFANPSMPTQHRDIHNSPGVSEAGTYSAGAAHSTHSLLGALDDKGSPPKAKKRGPSSITAQPLKGFPRRLKSALRSRGTTDIPETPKKEYKTVTWTADPVEAAISQPPTAETSLKALPGSPHGTSLEPADPISVLHRSGEGVAGTSTEAQDHATVIDTDDFMPGGIVMRDRVLVKVGRHRQEYIQRFDEEFQRREPCYRLDDAEEYIIGMTMTSVDLYVDWSFKCQERYKGFKRLRFTIPLAPPTTISVFNSRDMMLCLLCPWSVVMRHTVRHQGGELPRTTSVWDRFRSSTPLDKLGLERSGLGIFLLKFGERTRALDWHWYICQQLGYRLPKQIDIRIPALNQTVRLAIPEEAASSAINRESTLKTLWSLVLSSSSQRRVLADLGEIPRMELAWKGPDSTLDWVAYDTTITGKNREWALLASFAQARQEGKQATLQARPAVHRAAKVTLENGTSLEEPPGVEGYLMLHRSGSSKELLYVSINDGVAFISPAANGDPPMLPKREGSTPGDLFPDILREFFNHEHQRMSKFIERCTGILELRDIVDVQLRKPEKIEEQPPTASPVDGPSGSTAPEGPQTSPQVSPSAPPATSPKTHTLTTEHSRSSSGHHHISMHTVVEKEGTKKQREFIVTLRDNHTVKFEAHTPAVAAEWVERLQELVRYWTRYHRVRAREYMDMVAMSARGDAWVSYYLDPHANEVLDNVWNWCVIEGCRSVTMGGYLFIKRGKYRKFKSVYMVITKGKLVTFRITGASGLQNRSRVWPLFGAYIYSGMLAQDELRETVNEMAFNPSARMYGDGLRSTDGAEDTTFCIRLTWPTGAFTAPQPWDKENDADKFDPPNLAKEPSQLLICRARSRLERDRWVWALNAEKERCGRAHPLQGETMRCTGNLPRYQTLLHINGTDDAHPAFGFRNSSVSSLGSGR